MGDSYRTSTAARVVEPQRGISKKASVQKLRRYNDITLSDGRSFSPVPQCQRRAYHRYPLRASAQINRNAAAAVSVTWLGEDVSSCAKNWLLRSSVKHHCSTPSLSGSGCCMAVRSHCGSSVPQRGLQLPSPSEGLGLLPQE